MADAYATLASGGIHHPPTAITKVVFPDGSVVNLGDSKGKRVFPYGEAYAADQVLKTVIQSGTGTAANYGCPAAGKTGTTTSFTDAYFDGYTPQLATAVWVGYPNATTSMANGFGGTLAAPIWHDYMVNASDGYCGDFTSPSDPFHGTPFIGHFARRIGDRHLHDFELFKHERLELGHHRDHALSEPHPLRPAASARRAVAVNPDAQLALRPRKAARVRQRPQPELRRRRNQEALALAATRGPLQPVVLAFSCPADHPCPEPSSDAQGRESRARRRGSRGAAERDVPRQARQHGSRRPRTRRRQDAAVQDPDPARRPGQG
jgi:membrane peptidoglycan carboxypeptidase